MHDTWFHPQLLLSEVISGLVWVLGILMLWTYIKTSSAMDTSFKRRTMGALGVLGLTAASMFAGMALSNYHVENDVWQQDVGGGHGWGNPALCFGIAMTQPVHVFEDWHILVLGISYVVCQFIGAVIGLVIYFIYVWVNNSTSRLEKHIRLDEVFKWDTTHPTKVFAKDAIMALILVASFIGATHLGNDLPASFPSENARVVAVFTAALVGAGLVATMGKRSILTINPIGWFAAFVIKFINVVMKRKRTTVGMWMSELAAPVAVIGVGAVWGLLIYGMLQIPTYVQF